jgi:hypothetical protein
MTLFTSANLVSSTLVICSLAAAADNEKIWKPEIPRVWDEVALADWMTPVAGLNVRPSHISPTGYYAIPEYNLRSYPVYMPGREPAGYWEMLQRVGPQPLFEPEKLKTEADWIAAGERIFEEAAIPQMASFDPQLIAQMRDPEFMRRHDAKSLPNGTILLLRWLPTSRGVGLAQAVDCAAAVTHCVGWMARVSSALPVWPTCPASDHLTSAA